MKSIVKTDSRGRMVAKEARKAIRWFQKKMGITDWKFNIEIGGDRPDWSNNTNIGCSKFSTEMKTATLWCGIEFSRWAKETLLSTLFHEALHVVLIDIGIEHPVSGHIEFAINRFAYVLESLYLAETKAGEKINGYTSDS